MNKETIIFNFSKKDLSLLKMINISTEKFKEELIHMKEDNIDIENYTVEDFFMGYVDMLMDDNLEEMRKLYKKVSKTHPDISEKILKEYNGFYV